MTSNREAALRELFESGLIQEVEFLDRLAALTPPPPSDPSLIAPCEIPSPVHHSLVHQSSSSVIDVYKVRPPEPVSRDIRRRSVRVFVSSTLKDMSRERDALQRQVFPQLRRMCTRKNLDFIEVDLRWGITSEESSGGKVISLCLSEVDRCRPYFIGLLGERYGWSQSSSQFQDRRLSESLRLAGESEFPWVLEYADRSVTELEILYGALFHPRLATGAAFYLRNPESNAGEEREEETEKSRRMLEDLKRRIRESGLTVRDGYGTETEMAEAVLRDFTRFIERDYPEGEVRETQEEEEERQKTYVGRREYWETMEEFVRKEQRRPLVVTGPSGCGRTALMSSLCGRARGGEFGGVVGMTVCHYGELSGSSLGPLVSCVARAIAPLLDGGGGGGVVESEESPDSGHSFAHWLKMASAKVATRSKVCLVMLDGLECLDSKAQSLAWLPEVTPPGVRLVVSAQDESTAAKVLASRKCPTLRIQPLTDVEKRQLISESLAQYGKRISDSQTQVLAGSALTQNPLFLCTVLDQLRIRGSHEELESCIKYYLSCSGDPGELFQKVLGNLERDYGQELVSVVLPLIHISRGGLTEGELREVGRSSAQGEASAALAWSQLLGMLVGLRLVVERGGTCDLAHAHVRQAVRKRYLPTRDREVELARVLASYFRDRELDARKLSQYPFLLAFVGDTASLASFVKDIRVFHALYRDATKIDFLGFCSAIKEKSKVAEHYRAELFATGGASPPKADDVRRLAKFHVDLGDAGTGVELMREAFRLSVVESNSQETRGVADVKTELAETLMHSGAFVEALQVATDAYEMRKRVKAGRQHVAWSLWLLALLHKKLGGFEQALAMYVEALDIVKKKLGSTHPTVSLYLLTMGDVHRKMANYKEAEECYVKGLEIASNAFGEWHPKVAELLHALGRTHEKRGDYVKALSFVQRAKAIVEKVLGEDHSECASVNMTLANVYRHTGKLDAALQLYSQCKSVYELSSGKTHPDVAECLRAMGLIQLAKGQPDLAEASLRSAISLAETVFGPSHVTLARFSTDLADVLSAKAHYDEATSLYTKAVEINRASLGPEHPEVAEALSSQGSVAKKRGNYLEAQSLLREALRIVEKVYGERHYKVATLLQSLGGASRKLKRLDEAWDEYSRALALNEELLGPSHASVGNCLNGLGVVQAKRGNFDEAWDLHSRALEIFERSCGVDHPQVAVTLNYLGEVQRKRGRYGALDNTEELYRRALRILTKTYGTEHPEIAEVLNGLAQVLKNQFNTSAAESLFVKSIEMSTRLLGEASPHVRNRWRNLADLYERAGLVDKAGEAKARAEEISRRHGLADKP